MVKVTEELPPFLSKLIDLTKSTDHRIARWNAEGTIFVILNDEEFRKILKKYFKGTKQTFIRQLHFYGFKKIDSNEGNWGFTQENGLFIRDDMNLVKTIKRKKKVDPDSQKIATYAEVQSLKNQVHFCQEIIDELQNELVSLRGNRVDSGTFSKKPAKLEDTKEMHSKKRMRSSDFLDFETLCSKVNVSQLPETDLTRLPSFSNVMDLDSDLENLSDILVDLELEPLESQQLKRMPSYQDILLSEETKFSEAVEVVAEATNVKKQDVSKIISFLSKLSLKEQPKFNLESSGLGLSDILSGPRVQKVGAS